MITKKELITLIHMLAVLEKNNHLTRAGLNILVEHWVKHQSSNFDKCQFYAEIEEHLAFLKTPIGE